ncbi:hypothetical protein M0R45_001032 [Rubus argutus]|uniref:Uncharacterized protein n=1 Tax=Rubus argutus TaxID=59490 RepID=A0AAW1VMQ3_RUBAR
MLIHAVSNAKKPKPNFPAHLSSQMSPISIRCPAAFPAASPTKPRLTFLLCRYCRSKATKCSIIFSPHPFSSPEAHYRDLAVTTMTILVSSN